MQISHNGTTIDVPVTAKAVHKATLMKEDYIKLVFDSDVDYKFKAGDYITYEGMNYYLHDDYFPTMKDEATFSYELQFNAPWYNLDIAMFLFDTYENGVVVRRESDWYITDTAVNILNLLARSTENREDCPISLVFCEPTVAKTFTFSSTSIIGALNMLAKEFELEWWFTYENGYFILHFGECDNSVYSIEGEVQFSDGARVKDPSLVTQLVVGENVSKPSVSQNNGLRRFYYVFGSSRNIDQTVDVEQANNGFVTSIVTKRLALAGNPQDMLEGSGEEVVIFDDIYPRSDYQVTGVTPIEIQSDEYIGDDGEGNPQYKKYNVYNLKIDGFSEYVFSLINDPNEDVQNIEDIVASGKPLSIKFITKDHEGQTVTPKLAGFEFEVGATLVTDENTGNSWYEFQIIKQDINGYIIPNDTLIPEIGDWVCFYNVKGKYIDGNSSNNSQTELLNAFNKWYANKKRDVSYTVKPFVDSDLDLGLGDAVELIYSDNTVLSRIYSYEKHIDYKIDASYTISSYAKMGSINQLKDDVKILAASIANGTSTGVDMRALNAYMRRLFLSKVDDDTAAGKITFKQGTDTKGNADFTDLRGFLSGWLGYGARIDNQGNGEFNSVYVRGAIHAAELIFNNISAEEGEAIRSIGHGEIIDVDTENMVATLKLEGDEWATISSGDICRGMYNTVNKGYDNALSNGEDANGFRLKAGFFSSYFKVEEVLTNSRGECSFRYSLQPNTTEHPCPLMKFAVYGNFDDNKKDRQSSMYITAVGIAPRLLYLTNVNDWQIKPQNIKVALGYLEGLNVYEILNGEPSLKTLHGDAGLFVEDNIYFGGILNQFTAADWQYIQDMLGQGLHAQLLRGSDNIVVDALGNVVGGIYTIDTSGTSVVRRYKLHTGVLVYDSGKKMYLKAKPVDDETELKDDEFYLSYSCDGCTALRDGADFYITSIRNTNDGLSETTLTDEQLALMRNTNECRIHFIIATANGWRTQITYPVKITHLDKSYITFNLDNEYDAISYRTQSKRFAGLPIEVNLNAQANGEQLPASAFVSTTIESDLFSGQVVVNGNIDNTKNLPCGIKITTSRSGKVTLSHAFAGAETDMEDSKHYIDISSVVRYAGAEYESGKRRFTLQETTDATIYKLLLSATAISKNDNGYEPNSVDVKLQVWDESGQSVGIPNGTTGQVYVDGVALTDIYVKYVYGTYSPSGNNTYHATPPVLGTDVVTCFTIVALDTNTNSVLDVQSVTINAVGRDGAGQPWLWTNPKSIIVIDCDKDGYPLTNHSETIEARLYWGDAQCRISGSNNVSVEYGGSSQEVSVSNDVASCTISISKLSVLTSSNIVITITGTDSNNEIHTAQESIAVIANRKGETGNAGAGQSQVIFNTDKKIIDCDSNGSPAVSTDFDLSASLVFGEELCELTSATMVWSSDGGDAPNEGQISYSFDVDTAYKRFTFLPTGRYWSGLITVTLTGTLNGVTHTASQTVAVEINKSGKGISSVVTYYKAFIFHEGVTAPATNVNPTGDGWSSSYIEPTEECPYLWRFTRTTYTDGSKTQTDCELVQVWSNVVNRNLLSDTEFINGQMSMWNIKGSYSSNYTPVVANIGIASSSSQYNGHNSYRSQFRSNSDEPSNVAITLLGQILYADSGAHIIEEGKWYTLSFMASMYSGTSSYTYGSVNLDINLKGIVDTDSPRYIDGEEQNIGDTVGGTTLDVDNFHYAQFKNTSSGWKKHSFTFKAKPSLANIIEGSNSVPLMVRFMTTGVKSEQRNVYLSVPKLEVGMVATAYEAKRPVNEPISRRDEWAAGVQYYQGSTGEPYMDVVHYNNQWFKCLISHISNSSNKPVEDTLTAFWQPFSSVPFLASGLILGEQGIINLLFSQKIMIYNEANQLAASINQDKKGSYCIYYPETGRKMMEFSAKGYINYYNDNDGNTLEWRLGHGASVADDSTDDWKPEFMAKLSSSNLMFDENTDFTRTEYYYLSAGSSGNYAGFSGLYSTHSNDIPIQQTPLAEGWYTKDVAPWEHLSDAGITWYGIVMLHVTHTQATSGGSTYNVANITEKKIRYFTGTSYVEEVIN